MYPNIMNIFTYATKPITRIASEFGVDVQKGLDKKEAAGRMAKFGRNTVAVTKATGWHIFARQFKSSFVYLLLAAMVITVLLGEIADTLMIGIFLVITSGLGFYQEYSSEKTAALLNTYALPRAKVVRDGNVEQITADQLVQGDVVMLETGDRVPADIRLIAQDRVMIDETVLTGESAPVPKKAERMRTTPSSYNDALNLAFSGTDVVKGDARGIVVATGKDTAFGHIAALAGTSRKMSDFEKGISHFSQFILQLIGVTLLVVLVAHVLIKGNGVDMLTLIIFSIALTVSVIPEAMPLVTAFSLARAARRLAKQKVIVKRLSAIEDLGGIEILCSDKTGTLTENTLTIAAIYAAPHEQTLWLANLASSFSLQRKIESFDLALEKGLSPDQRQRIKKAVMLSDESFDPKTRKNSTLVADGDTAFCIIRGAPEAIVASCSALDTKAKDAFSDWMGREGALGRRVLAVGYKAIKVADHYDVAHNQQLKKNNFIFSGAISFTDPIKKSSFAAVEHAKRLGVKVMIITGDRPEVAGAVAHDIGLIDSPDKVLTGEQWQRADKEMRDTYLEQYVVFARVSPEIKFALVQALREKHAIGFLGEGINDAPALKIAGVSLVVDSAADIAREAADIILLQKDLGAIMNGIREGRRVFANTTKYIKSTLASNFGNFFAVATASLLIDFLPMLPIQILLVNLLSDAPMISIATDTVEAGELRSPKKYEAKDIIIIAMILGLVSMVFDFIFFGLFYRISPEVLQTNWFIGSILTELVLLFSIRTRSLFSTSLRPSSSIIGLSLLTFVATLGLPFTAFGQKVFKFTPPTPVHPVWILSLVVIYFVISETVKLFYYKSKAHALASTAD